ncbi:MAG TPA: HAD family hydrolase [Polyangiaceae bacterium]|nr:HAD family hydrolase [Polyangiaceae bacterium]
MAGLRDLWDGVKHVVWDWNGTLLDDVDHCVRVVNGMLREDGLQEISAEEYRAVFDFPVRGYYERLGFDLSGDRFVRLAHRFIAAYDRGATECRLHAGAVPVLERLSARGATSSILSAARTASIHPLLDHHGIADHFTAVAGLDDHYAASKVERGLAWLAEHGHDRAALLLVGDTAHDHEVATALGVRVVLVAAGHQSRERLEALGSPVVERLEDLL